jgi:hypothetical protein
MKRKKDNNVVWIVLGISALILFWYGGTSGWFQGIFNQSNTYSFVDKDINEFLKEPHSFSGECTLDLSPNSIYSGDQVTGRIYDGKNTMCWVLASDGGPWGLVYEGRTDNNGYLIDTRNIDIVGNFVFRAICDANKNERMDTQDCLTNQETLTVLGGNCVDSDGNDKYTPGNVKSGGVTYYDKCVDSTSAVTEYTCVDGSVVATNLACDYGQVCFETRSGGYCGKSGSNVGDVVGGGSSSGIITGSDNLDVQFDLGGITVGGNCRLGAKIHTEWDYANDKCSGIMGTQGLDWLFIDSQDVKWGATDTSPRIHDEDLCPLVWDGINQWKLKAIPLSSNLPECQINYKYTVQIYVCECQ